jgi:hypothetical protein
MRRKIQRASVKAAPPVKGKAPLTRKAPATVASLSAKARACAKLALDAAVLSEKDAGWAQRVAKARAGLKEVGRVLDMLGAARRKPATQKRQLALEERRLAVQNSRSERAQWAFEAEERRRNPRSLTREEINGIRARVFGLGPDPHPVAAPSPASGGEQGPAQSRNGGEHEKDEST